MLKPFSFCLLAVLVIAPARVALSEERLTFATEYTTISYQREEDLVRFLERISGSAINVQAFPGFAKSRVDRIIEQVQAILDMYPERFHVDVLLYPRHESGPIAFYADASKAITVYTDRVTDGVFAHEISHAVIRSYFKTPPPNKVTEILSQYVDRHLWIE